MLFINLQEAFCFYAVSYKKKRKEKRNKNMPILTNGRTDIALEPEYLNVYSVLYPGHLNSQYHYCEYYHTSHHC